MVNVRGLDENGKKFWLQPKSEEAYNEIVNNPNYTIQEVTSVEGYYDVQEYAVDEEDEEEGYEDNDEYAQGGEVYGIKYTISKGKDDEQRIVRFEKGVYRGREIDEHEAIFEKSWGRIGGQGWSHINEFGFTHPTIKEAIKKYLWNKTKQFAQGGEVDPKYADGGKMADGGNVSVGKKWKQEWTDTNGVEGYDILEIVDTKWFSNSYQGGMVIKSKIIQSSKPERIGKEQEEHKNEMRKIFSGKYPFAYKMADGGKVANFDVKKFTALIAFDDNLRNLYYDKAESQGIDSSWDVYAIQEGKEKPNAEELKIMKDIFNSEIKTDAELLKVYSTADVDFRKNVEKKNSQRRNK